MAKGEEGQVSEAGGSEVESEAEETGKTAPEDPTAARLSALEEKVEQAVQAGKIAQGELHKERDLRTKDAERFTERLEAERKQTEELLARLIDGKVDENEARTIKETLRSERERSDREAELAQLKSRDEEEKAKAQIRAEGDRIVKQVAETFGVEIPKDKVPDPTTFEDAAAFILEVNKVAKQVLQAKPPTKEEKPKDEEEEEQGALASLSIGQGAPVKENPLVKRTASENIRAGVQELRTRHKAEAAKGG